MGLTTAATTSSLWLPRLTLTRASRLLQAGLLSSQDLCAYCYSLARAGEDEWQLNAYTRLPSLETILEDARASDERRRQRRLDSANSSNKETSHPLEGIPVSFKANIAVAQHPLTAASQILQEEHACGYNADVSQTLLRTHGAVLVGINNMDEFGMGSFGTFGANGTATRNPVNLLQHLRRPTHIKEEDFSDAGLAERIRELSRDEIYEVHAKAAAQEKEQPITSAGGSSCGSAAAVAHGSALASLGTDTGGSVRLPAAWCHVVGLKPSYGVLSRHGVVSYASSLDTVGILAPSVECAETVLHSLVQQEGDPRDSTAAVYSSSQTPQPDDTKLKQEEDPQPPPLAGVRVGLPAAFCVQETPVSIQAAWASAAEWLQDQGASVVTLNETQISPDSIQHSLAAYYVLATAEASSNLARYDGFRYGRAVSAPVDEASSVDKHQSLLESQYAATRTAGLGVEVQRRILCGTSVLSADRFHTYYEAAAKLRAVVTQQLHQVLHTEVDVLLLPTALSFAPSLEGLVDPTEMFANDVMTVPISLAGLPSISVPVPCCQDEGKDATASQVGLQVVGGRLDESRILQVAKILQDLHHEVE